MPNDGRLRASRTAGANVLVPGRDSATVHTTADRLYLPARREPDVRESDVPAQAAAANARCGDGMNDLEELERQSVGWAQVALLAAVFIVSVMAGFLLVSWVLLHA